MRLGQTYAMRLHDKALEDLLNDKLGAISLGAKRKRRLRRRLRKKL